jgi:hypothetical protein
MRSLVLSQSSILSQILSRLSMWLTKCHLQWLHTFVNAWLAHYPKPMSCVHDPGLEFIGRNFQEMLHCNNIQSCCTTTKNPLADAICKWMHQSIGNSLRVIRQWNPPAGLNDVHALVDSALANTMYAIRASFHSGLQIHQEHWPSIAAWLWTSLWCLIWSWFNRIDSNWLISTWLKVIVNALLTITNPTKKY